MKKYGPYVIKKMSDGTSEHSPDSFFIFKNDDLFCECFDLDTAQQVVCGLLLLDDFVSVTGGKLKKFFKKTNKEK